MRNVQVIYDTPTLSKIDNKFNLVLSSNSNYVSENNAIIKSNLDMFSTSKNNLLYSQIPRFNFENSLEERFSIYNRNGTPILEVLI